MKLGLLGALGGFAGAANEIADTSIREREKVQAQELAEKSAMQRQQWADDRLDKREQLKLQSEDARMRQRSGLLGEVLKKLPPEATDFDRARAATEAGLHEEAKPYLELAKAGDMSEHRARTFEAQQAKWDAQIELQRARLEATAARGEASAAGGGATPLQKDAAWMVQNGMAPDLPAAFKRLRSDPSESRGQDWMPTAAKEMAAFDEMPETQKVRFWDAAVREEADKNQRSGGHAFRKPEAARQAAEETVRAKFGPRPSGASTLQSAAPSSDAPAQLKSKAEYDALPSGARYTAPDGSVRMKP